MDKTSQKDHKILVVDDDFLVLTALQKTLQREGYQVLKAFNGQIALDILKQQPVALIICDQRMPGLTGIEVLQQAQILQPEAIRIILTGNSELETVLQAINVGQVSQFLVKPWDEANLMQVVRSSLERYMLKKDNERLHELTVSQHQALELAHNALRQEMQLGARIHETMLVGKLPGSVPGIAIDATTIPSREIDGDFFEFYRPAPQFLDIVFGDVMGKGIPAALVGTAVKTQLMRFAIPFNHVQIFTKENYWEEDLLKPHEILSHVHTEIISQLINLEYFVSLFYARLNLKKHTMTFVDCGSTKPIHYKAAEKKTEALLGDHFPIGTVEKNEYHLIEVPYNIGDIFVFYSDGITETKSPTGELFGFERLVQLVKKSYDLDPSSLITYIKNSVINFAQKNHFDDDLTLIILKINHIEEPMASASSRAKFFASLTQLKAVREFVARVCSKAQGDVDKFTSQLQLAINEIFCNIVLHGYKGISEGNIIIEGDLTSDGLFFHIADQGHTFDPEKVKEPSLAGDRVEGFGWYLIREIADQVVYKKKESDKGWNHLHIFKKFTFEGRAMQFAHSTQEEVLIIIPEGSSLDAKDAPEFKEKVIGLITSNDSSQVVFDLHNLQFIDSSGLGSLLSVLRVLHSSGGELKLASMSRSIRTMFELVSMHKIFEIYNTTAEAVRSFQNLKA